MKLLQYTGQLTKNGEVLKTWTGRAYMANVELLRQMIQIWDDSPAPNDCSWRYHETVDDIVFNSSALSFNKDHKFPALSLLWFSRYEHELVLNINSKT